MNLQPTLIGKIIKVRPLLESDFEALYLAASDPRTWAMHPDSERYKKEVFAERVFDGALKSGTAFVVEEIASKTIIGGSRFYDWDEASKEIAIGYTFIAHQYWGSGVNDELKQLMLNHIFQEVVDAVWFHVGKDNIRSRRAVEKLGATLEYEKTLDLRGEPFVQLYYRLTKQQHQ